jgi:CheY-like chemotaxis protein
MRRHHTNEGIGPRIDVLIVDPISADANRASTALRKWTSDISTVRVMHADQALRLMLNRGLFGDVPELPRLILLDVAALPDGKYLLKTICSNARTREIPVIVLSASVDPMEMTEFCRIGAKECVTKSTTQAAYESGIVCVASRWLSRAARSSRITEHPAVSCG